MEDYAVVRKLAQGGQGSTLLVKPKTDSSATLVLKQCKCENLKAANDALREAKTLQRLKHTNIVLYIDVFLHEEDNFLVICTLMEYCEKGDLACYMNALKAKGSSLEEKRIMKWTLHMAQALDYLHQQQILHRDIKPLNVFLSTDGAVKLGDFGLASSTKREKATSKVGTPCYLAPEILQNEDYGNAIDVWGVGCIGMEMMTFDFLWERKGMLSVQVLSRAVTEFDFPQNYSADLRRLVVSMLDKEPQKRPTAARVAKQCRLVLSGGSGSGIGFTNGEPPSPLAAGIDALGKGVGALFGGALQGEADPKVNHNKDFEEKEPSRNPYAGKVADFRRKTPVQMGGKPNGTPDTKGHGTRPRPSKKQALCSPERVKAMLNMRGLGHYVSRFEEQEVFGEILVDLTESDLANELGIQNIQDRAAIMRAMGDLLAGIEPGPLPKDQNENAGRASSDAAAAKPSPQKGSFKEQKKVARSSSITIKNDTPSPTEVTRWLYGAGFSQYRACFQANGITKLRELVNLSRSQLIAMGIPQEIGPDGNAVVDLLVVAIKGVEANFETGISGGHDLSLLAREEAMFQEAIKLSLNEYEEEVARSASSSAPSSRQGPLTGPLTGATGPPTNTSAPRSGQPSLRRENSGTSDAPLSSGAGSRAPATVHGVADPFSASRMSLSGVLDVLIRDGKGWRTCFCSLENNSLRMWFRADKPDVGIAPDHETVMDGLCVDVEDGRSDQMFIRKSMYTHSDGDLHLRVRIEEQSLQWLQRLQASAYFMMMSGSNSIHTRVKSIVLQILEIHNASALFQHMVLAVNVATPGGQVLYNAKEINLANPTEKALMKFELWANIKAPTEENAVLFFEVKHHNKSGKPQPTKYWTCLQCSNLQQGTRYLQIFKAPVEYNISKQKNLPKRESKLHVALTN